MTEHRGPRPEPLPEALTEHLGPRPELREPHELLERAADLLESSLTGYERMEAAMRLLAADALITSAAERCLDAPDPDRCLDDLLTTLIQRAEAGEHPAGPGGPEAEPA